MQREKLPLPGSLQWRKRQFLLQRSLSKHLSIIGPNCNTCSSIENPRVMEHSNGAKPRLTPSVGHEGDPIQRTQLGIYRKRRKKGLSTNVHPSSAINIINLMHCCVSPYRSSERFFGGKKMYAHIWSLLSHVILLKVTWTMSYWVEGQGLNSKNWIGANLHVSKNIHSPQTHSTSLYLFFIYTLFWRST